MSTPPPAPPRGRPLDQVLNWAPGILFAVVLPFLTYGFLTDRHIVGQAPALLISGLWPALESVATLVIRRRVDELGVFVLITLLIGVLGMVAFNSPEMILVKDSAMTGLIGLVFLVSLLLPRPLMFYFGRKFATNGTRAGARYWNGLWRYPAFRHTQRVLTVVWGIAFIAEAALRIVLVAADVMPVRAELLVSNIFPYVVLAGLIAFTFGYTRFSVRKNAAAREATEELKRLSRQ